jgi:NarL family two-component system sensor histidine kinase YdfH
MAAQIRIGYNPGTMNPRASVSSKVENDYRIFFVFMIAVLVGIYVLSLMENPALRQSWMVIPFTILLVVHIIIHWNVTKIIQKRGGTIWYILIQSALAFVIIAMSHHIGMIFALYMALTGETIGILRSTLWRILSALYYLALSVLGFMVIANVTTSLWGLFGAIPIVIFVSMYVTLYNRQNEAREQAQALAAELETANRQLTEYAARVEDLTILAERQRMARELHDTLSQGLAGLILQLEAADAHLASSNAEKARSILANAMQQARATLADARRAIDDLRQPSLDDLDSLLRLETSRFTNATGIPCVYQSYPTPPIPDPVKETVLRAVAEALTNVAHHARARNVAVSVQGQDKSLSVTIRDDGVGFDPSAIPPGHYGLLGIRERVRLLNGSLDIQTDHGTLIKIQIPLQSSVVE